MKTKRISKKQRKQLWENSHKVANVLFSLHNWIEVLDMCCPDFTKTTPSGTYTITKADVIKSMKDNMRIASKKVQENMHITDYNNWDEEGNLLDDEGNVVLPK